MIQNDSSYKSTESPQCVIFIGSESLARNHGWRHWEEVSKKVPLNQIEPNSYTVSANEVDQFKIDQLMISLIY